jgi:hypothetical protein
MDALIEVALAVLEDAIKRCGTENGSTAEILLALGFLKSQVTIIRRFDEFRKSLAHRHEELKLEKKSDDNC